MQASMASCNRRCAARETEAVCQGRTRGQADVVAAAWLGAAPLVGFLPEAHPLVLPVVVHQVVHLRQQTDGS